MLFRSVITMRIDALNHVSRLYQQSKPTKNVRTEKKYAKDEFQISQTAKDYQIAKQAVKDTEDVREDKVNKYKDAIASGTYNVSSQEIAEKMVSKYFDSLF